MGKYANLAEAIRNGTIETPDDGNAYISGLRERETYKAQGGKVGFDFDATQRHTAIDLLEALDGADYEDEAIVEWADREVSCYTWDLKCAALAFGEYEYEAEVDTENKPSYMGAVDYVGQQCWYEAARQYAYAIKEWADAQDIDEDEETESK